jgi:Fic family protein
MKKYDLKSLIRKLLAKALNANSNYLSIVEIASNLDIGIYTSRVIFSELKARGLINEVGRLDREKAIEYLELKAA